jgi:TonB family protein
MARGGRFTLAWRMTSDQPSIISVLTLTLWIVCLGIGVAGYFLPYARPQRVVQSPPVEARFIEVKLGSVAPAPPSQRAAGVAAASDSPPPPMSALLPDQAPPPFVETIGKPAAAPAPAMTQLTYGVGAGAQPAPDYPREAALAGEEGVVVVEFTVDENGNVPTADVATACRWPILNEAAVRSIRDTWNFGPGPKRAYEISITYHLESR